MSLLEIYNESIKDLLEPMDAETRQDKKLDVKINPKGPGNYVPGAARVTPEPTTSKP